MTSPKFIVIGSNSFSGSHFVSEALKLGFEVYGISRSEESLPVFLPYRWEEGRKDPQIIKKFHFQKIDLNQDLKKLIELVDFAKPSHIINFAAQGMVAQSWQNPTHWYQTNVLSQVALHDELRKREFLEKYVHVTTPEVYGNTDNNWIKEDHKFSPSTPYAVSRAACDMHLKSFYDAYGFPVVFTRSANVYGPGQQLYRIIPRTILSGLSLEKLNLHGGGNSIRSFIHISDVVNATLKLALNASPGTSWHLSTNDSISIKDLVRKICSKMEVEFDAFVESTDERLGKDQSYLLDSSSIRKEFNWKEKISLSDGINQTIDWVNRNYKLLYNEPWDYVHKL